VRIFLNSVSHCNQLTAASFQEKLFSQRSLQFINGQVVFNCRRAREWREDVVFEDETGIVGNLPMPRERNDIGEFEGLIQDYSDMSLTYDSDIYNAFAGIAKYITRELKSNLCHGIPEAYFDWFLLWTTLKPQTRRKSAPSWSWSGWIGGSWPRIWDWYTRNMKKVGRAQRNRTWIIWYQRMAHNSDKCSLVWEHDNKASKSPPRNFYRGAIRRRFDLDCSKTIPMPRKLDGTPEYTEDTLNPRPGTGFLQFWTVSVTFRLDTPTSKASDEGPPKIGSRVGIFGQSGEELGIVFVDESWRMGHVPGEHEFILLCEGRDERAETGREDDEDGWKYMVMLLEWHGEWAERVSVGSIEKHDLYEALGDGTLWKEIILG